MAIHHNLADKLTKKKLALDAFTAPTPNNTGEKFFIEPLLTPVKKQITKRTARMTSNITLSLKINTTKNRHIETTKKTTKDCTHTTNNMIHPKTNYKHSTNLYKIHDFELDKTKNTINKLQFDKHFVKEKAWKKTQIEIENNEKYGSTYNYYQQKYNNLPDLNCPLCNNTHETTEHIFTQCPKTKHIRIKLLKKMKTLLKEGIWRSKNDIHNSAGKLYIPTKDKTTEWKLALNQKRK